MPLEGFHRLGPVSIHVSGSLLVSMAAEAGQRDGYRVNIACLAKRIQRSKSAA